MELGTPQRKAVFKSPVVCTTFRRLRFKTPPLSRSSSGTASLPTIPCCTTHRRPSVLRVVTKEGENKGRHFYTCALPRDSKCNFFEVKV